MLMLTGISDSWGRTWTDQLWGPGS